MKKNQDGKVREKRRDADAAAKLDWKPGTMLNPVPVVLVSCGDFSAGEANVLTVAWAGTVCSEPPMLSVSIRPERHSHAIISRTREFVVNLPTARMTPAVDFCGVRSGRDTDKFKATGLTPVAADKVRAPLVDEAPVNLECRVTRTLHLGSHDLFLAEIVAVHVDASLLDKRGKLHLERAQLVAYAHGDYFALGRILGRFGYSTYPNVSVSIRGNRKKENNDVR